MEPSDDAAEELFACLLAGYDEALAAGAPAPLEDGLAPAVAERLRRARACLDRLERAWPRSLPAGR